MLRRLVVLLPVLSLIGCSETDILQYQGRPAMSALECRAAFEEARARGASAPGNYTSGASAIGTVIGKSLANGMIESSYNTCLARVAALPPGTAAPMSAPRDYTAAPRTYRGAPQTSLSAGCVPGGSVLQGGASYCMGN